MLKIALAAVLGIAATGAAITYVATRPGGTRTTSSARTAAPETSPQRAMPSHAARPDRAEAPRAVAAPPTSPAEMNVVDDDVPRLAPDEIAEHHLHEGPARGPADAPVQIVVYQDLECLYCAKVLGTIDQLWEDYPGKLRLVVKQFPLPAHPHAQLGAEASLAADAQGKFWPFHDLVLANQDELSRELLVELAGQAGLDVAAFTRALDEHTYAEAVQRDVDDGEDIGVDATPVFFINGRRFTGAQPIEAFRAAIDAELASQ